jgi:hypothetical protein
VIRAVFWNATLCNLLLCEFCNLEARVLYHEGGGVGCLRNVAKVRDISYEKDCSVETTTYRRAPSCVLQKEDDTLIAAPRLLVWCVERS